MGVFVLRPSVAEWSCLVLGLLGFKGYALGREPNHINPTIPDKTINRHDNAPQHGGKSVRKEK